MYTKARRQIYQIGWGEAMCSTLYLPPDAASGEFFFSEGHILCHDNFFLSILL